MLIIICKECGGESYGDTMCMACKEDRWLVGRGTSALRPVHQFSDITWALTRRHVSAYEAAKRIMERRKRRHQKRGRAVAARQPRKLEVAGSNPAPATDYYSYGSRVQEDAFRSFYEDYDMCWVCAHPRMIGRIECASERCRCNGCHIDIDPKARLGLLMGQALNGEAVIIKPRNHGRSSVLKQLRIMNELAQKHRNSEKERRSSDEEHSPVTREVTGSSPAGAANDELMGPRIELRLFKRGMRPKEVWDHGHRETAEEPFWKDNYDRTYATVKDITTEHLKNIALYLKERMRTARPNRGAKHYFKWLAVRNEMKARESTRKFEDELKGSPFGRPPAEEVKSTGVWDGHWSDCGTHNESAYPNGPCNCGGYPGIQERRAPGADESPKPMPGGSTPSASASNEYELLRALIHFWTRDVGFSVGDPGAEARMERYVLDHFSNWPTVSRGGVRRMEVVDGIVKKLGLMLCGPCGDCGSACADGCLEESSGEEFSDTKDEDMPEFLIGWSDNETATEDLTAIIAKEYQRQSEFGMHPSPVDVATALLTSFREDEPEFDEIPGVDQGMFSPWRKDEDGRVDGV